MYNYPQQHSLNPTDSVHIIAFFTLSTAFNCRGTFRRRHGPGDIRKNSAYMQQNRYTQAPIRCHAGQDGGGQPANRNKKCPDTHPEQPRRMTRAAGVIPKMHLRRRAVNDKCRSFQPRHLPLVIIPSPSILHKSGRGEPQRLFPFHAEYFRIVCNYWARTLSAPSNEPVTL